MLALGLTGFSHLHGQSAPLQIIPQAQGHSTEKHVNLHVNGPSDTLQRPCWCSSLAPKPDGTFIPVPWSSW